MTNADTINQSNAVYLGVLNVIQNIYNDAEIYRPVQKKSLELTTDTAELVNEIKIRSESDSKLKRLLYTRLLPWKIRLGRYLMDNGKSTMDTDWGKYKESLVTNTDFRKFDGNLRMVISGNAVQRNSLEQFLKKQYQKGQLNYGLHISDRAIMTCVISDYNLHHIHFVDGADGGYAMAAKTLKKQLKDRSINKNN
jgi:hypothetical protein